MTLPFTQKTICPYDCPSSCGFIAEHDGKRILRVFGDPEHPVSCGGLCAKMRHYERSVHAPERILTPLKRAGEKGSGRFVPVSWEEATKEIAKRWQEILREDGGDAILPVSYSGVMGMIQRKCGDAFFNRLGACELVKSICAAAQGAGWRAVMGETGCLDPRELSKSGFYLIWGSNLLATQLPFYKKLQTYRKSGRRAVLIESCAIDTASGCDDVVLVRPGSDGALALSLMHVLLRDGLCAKEWLREQSVGFDAFAATLPQYTPQWGEGKTGVPAQRIETLAHEFASVKNPAILCGSGPTRQGNGGMNARLINLLGAFTGAWRYPGGGVAATEGCTGPLIDSARITRPDFRTAPARVININRIGAALTGADGGKAIRSLYVYAGNPAASVSDQTAVLRGLLRPDLFTVVHERFMTETARYADLILPATFSVEQSDCYGCYGYRSFGVGRRVIAPPGMCRSNFDTFAALAEAMGFDEPYFRQTEDQLLDELLAHPAAGLSGVPAEDLARIGREGGAVSLPFADHSRFQTASGKIMIINSSLDEPMPRYLESFGEQADAAERERFPLRLISVPARYSLNSAFPEQEPLRALQGELTVWLHPEAAAARGIKDGDTVLVWNELAKVEMKARISALVQKDTAAVPGVYGHGRSGPPVTPTEPSPDPFAPERLLFNALCHGRLADLADATTLNDNRVQIRRYQAAPFPSSPR